MYRRNQIQTSPNNTNQGLIDDQMLVQGVADAKFGGAVKSHKDINSPKEGLDNKGHFKKIIGDAYNDNKDRGILPGVAKLPQLDVTGKRSISQRRD